jgi:hypothetical protein
MIAKTTIKAELPLQSKKGSHILMLTCFPLFLVEATGVSIPTGHTEMLVASVYKSPLRAWRDADIAEL